MAESFQDVLQLEKLGARLIVRFNRPQIRSPLSIIVLEALDKVLDDMAPDIERVLFTGTDQTFASGADLREIANLRAEDAQAFARRGQELMSRIACLRQETIAAINGHCFGGALDLALACDTRTASPDATFAHPGSALGIITGWGGTQRLPRLIGTSNALELFFTASPVGAARALEIGLVDSITDDPLTTSLGGIPDL